MKDEQELALDKLVAINDDLEKFKNGLKDDNIKAILDNAILWLSVHYQHIGSLND